MKTYHSYDPAVGHGLPHDPLKAIIAPRPIGWISSQDRSGRVNLAPYSFFNLFSSTPPILIFGSEGRKDSLSNIEEMKEFVFNLATRALAESVNHSSGNFAADVDEFDEAGLEKCASDIVAPPRVAATPAAMECKLIEVKPLVDIEGMPITSQLIIGQVVRVHINPDYLDNGLFDITKAGTIARCGYRGDYIEATELFEMFRPKVNGR